jgi:ABC-type dipeptide/oligopeptide/nickel transport system ATPase subunit
VLDGVSKLYSRGGVTRAALEDVSFSVEPGRTLAIIGESGAGKSTLCKLIAGLEEPTSGTVSIAGEPPRVRPGRPAQIQMVFQDPVQALNPFWSIGRSVGEPLRTLRRGERRERVTELLQDVGVDGRHSRRKPRQFSGGQLQRVGVARALAAHPAVLLCDEPTSALDVSIQSQILNLLLRKQDDEGFACLLVTHDLHVARVLAHDVLVLYRGSVVEYSDADAFFAGPQDPYSQALHASMD